MGDLLNRWSKSGLEVTVLSGLSGISIALLIQYQKKYLVIDAGDGVSRDLHQKGLDPSDLVALALTHDHGDHTAGLTGLLWWSRLGWRRAPLRVFRPSRAPLAAGQVSLFKQVFGPPDRFEIIEQEWREGVRHDLSPFTVVPFAARHLLSGSNPQRGLMESYGFQVLAGSMRIVVSGDTGPTPELSAAVEGADLALIEATFPGDQLPPPDTHLTWNQAKEIGERALDWRPYHT